MVLLAVAETGSHAASNSLGPEYRLQTGVMFDFSMF